MPTEVFGRHGLDVANGTGGAPPRFGERRRDRSGSSNTSLIALCAALCAVPGAASAGISYTTVSVQERYYQSGATTVAPVSAGIGLGMAVQSPSDFTSAFVSYPGAGSPRALTYTPTLTSNGAYAGIFTNQTFGSVAEMNAAYPFGTYSFTAINSNTGASQTAFLNYDRDHWPDTVPGLTASGYDDVQGLVASQGGVFEFSSFDADGHWPFGGSGPETIDPYTQLVLFDAQGAGVYSTGPLQNETTSFTLPPEVLLPSSTYGYTLVHGTRLHLEDPTGAGGPGYALSHVYTTTGYFVTAAEDVFTKTLVDLQGGTFDNPTVLPVVGRIGELTGSIGGIGDTDFYQVFWQGGLFASSVNLTGADPDAKFLFRLYDKDLNLLNDMALTSANSFSATMTEFLPRGLFTIGLEATHPLDPEFSIKFITPVGNAVPEPGTWALLILGFGGVGTMLRRRRPQRVHAADA